MVYSTQAQVQDYLPVGYLIGTAPCPTSAQVTQYLTDTSNEIDAAIASRGIAVPVTAPTWFLAECVRLNAMGAAALVLVQIFPLQPNQPVGGYNSGSQSGGAQLSRRYDARLTEIRKGIGIPVGVAVAEADLSPRSYVTDYNAIGDPDGQQTDAWGDAIYSNAALPMRKVY